MNTPDRHDDSITLIKCDRQLFLKFSDRASGTIVNVTVHLALNNLSNL
ncbi:MAG: hypothetical protein HC930_08765 [Hydrococcus sp. SU_1_0]|nr:hypothetical protein [Hydrococcus sp. SU_1_0]